MPLPAAVLACLREAGRVASAVRDGGARLIRPGARLRDVCAELEDEIARRGARPAFPVQSSRNQIAAHYCPAPDDETAYAEGDLAKLDVGVHVDGWVVDTALTVNVGERPDHQPMIDAARAALQAAIAAVAPRVEVGQLSALIESTIQSYGLVPMRNLCGHGVGRWTVHSPPPIPNVAQPPSRHVLEEGAVVAIEPFATDGSGLVMEQGPAEVFRLREDPLGEELPHPELLSALRSFRGLPFARRQLSAFPPAAREEVLSALSRQGLLTAYPPLVEKSGRPVAQAEHTIYLGPDGVEVLTR